MGKCTSDYFSISNGVRQGGIYIMIGTEVLKYVDNTKYLGITFCETLKDDKDMIRQMRLLCTKSNKLLRIFSNCTTDVKLVIFYSYCTSLYCLFHLD